MVKGETGISTISTISTSGGKKNEDLDSINGTEHEVKVINPFKFSIGDTSQYSKYERNGMVKQVQYFYFKYNVHR